MIYDRSNPLHRKQFVKRCNSLLQKKDGMIELNDLAKRTPNQNSYLHVLIRIMAFETGVTESYAKYMYFKYYANPQIFVQETVDPITGQIVHTMRSSKELTIPEMSQAIDRFRIWACDNGYYLPEANINDKGEVKFASREDEEAYKKAEVETARAQRYL